MNVRDPLSPHPPCSLTVNPQVFMETAKSLLKVFGQGSYLVNGIMLPSLFPVVALKALWLVLDCFWPSLEAPHPHPRLPDIGSVDLSASE